MMRRDIRCVLMIVTLCILSAANFIYAQNVEAVPATALQDFASVGGGPDSVNLGDLNVHVSFQMIHKAGRGIDFNYSLLHDSIIWNSYGGAWTLAGPGETGESWSSLFGWNGAGPSGAGGFLTWSQGVEGDCDVYFGDLEIPAGIITYNYIYTDSNGTSHQFTNSTSPVSQGTVTGVQISMPYMTNDCGNYTQKGFPVLANDGSGIQLQCNGCTPSSSSPFSLTIVLPSGETITGSALTGSTNIQDNNGNYLLLLNGTSSGAASLFNGLPNYTDTLGYSVMNTTDEGTYTWTGTPTNNYGLPDGQQDGYGGPQDAAATVSYMGSDGSLHSYIVQNTAYEVATSFSCPNIVEFDSGSLRLGVWPPNYTNLITKLLAPDGTSYSFTYEQTSPGSTAVTGRIASITYPHGGSISYSYGPVNCADGSSYSLTRTINDGNGHTATWTYQRSYISSTSQWQTVETDPKGNQTVHLFITGSPAVAFNQGLNTLNFYEVSKTVYAGSVSGGNVLQVTNTCYNGNSSGSFVANCTTPLPLAYPIKSQQVAVMPNGGSLTGATVELFNTLSLPIETDSYDFGTASGQVGVLLSRTVISYAELGEISNKPSSIVQTDGAGKIISSTSYTYDEGSLVTTSGTPNHVSVSGPRGNLTTVSKSTGNMILSSHFTYYDTGLVNTASDINGSLTTYSYSQCGNSYPTATRQVVDGSQVVLSSSASWDCIGGVPVSTTDLNGNTTTITYNDPFARPTRMVDPLGDVTTQTYPSSSSNIATASRTYVGGLPSGSSLTTYDGLGRVILTQVQQGTSYLSSSQSFDPDGYIDFTSIPYTAPAGSYNTAIAGTNTTYDALGRPTLLTDAGGGTLNYTYSLNDVKIVQGPAATNENAKTRQLEYNAVGQLISVCEVTGGAPSGFCGQNSSATGYLTQYNYSGALLTSVSQNVQAGLSATQTRKISYDALGRKISEIIPETGTSSFVYDNDPYGPCGYSLGDLVKTVDNAGNITCMTYDSLHRLTGSRVASGPYASVTPQASYVYDVATLNGMAMQNELGSLAAVHTVNCPQNVCSGTDVYRSNAFETSNGQKTGRIISQMWESTPNSNGYILTQSVYNANGTPASLGASLNGASIGFPSMIFGLDALGRPSTATDTTNNIALITGTSYNNTTGAVTSLTYGNGDTDGFGYEPNTGRPSSFSYSVGGTNSFAISGGLTWNSNGSLKQFLMTDTSDSTKNQSCTYQMDDINRLASVNCAGSCAQNFTYDPFGNISKSGPAIPGPGQYTQSYTAGYNSINNQVISGIPAVYDQDGNQTVAGVAGTDNLSWNALAQPINVNGAGAVYDGFGRMVETDSYNLHTVAATGSTGSISIFGSEQFIPPTEPYQGNTTITVTGGPDQSMPINLETTSPNGCVPVVTGSPANATCYDIGGGYLVVLTYQVSNGAYVSASQFSWNFNSSSTLDSIADALAASINADTSVGFTATPLNNGSGQMSLVLQSTNNSPVYYEVLTGGGCGGAFPTCSFGLSGPSGTVSASPSGTYTAAIYDAGTVSVTINNGTPLSYVWSNGDTPTSIANSLAAQITQAYGNIVSVSPVVISSNGATIQLSSLTTGAATNYSIITSSTNDYMYFSSGSFGSVASGMSGGANSYSTGPLTGSTQYVYSPSGQKIAILQGGQLVKGTVPLPGGGTAIYNSGGLDYFRHKDWLGSSRLATKWDHSVYSKEAYAPFGEVEENIESPGTHDRSFTGQDQDTTLGIVDYLFRRYDPAAGRWLSPDPSGWGAVNPSYPQSLNRYAYVQNNPMQLTDPDGLDCIYQGNGGASVTVTAGQCTNGDGGQYVEGTITSLTFTNGVVTSGTYVPYGNANFGNISINDVEDVDQNGNYVNVTPSANLPCNQDASIASCGQSNFNPNDPSYQLAVALGNTGVYSVNTFGNCVVEALTSNGNGTSLLLDAAGFIPGESQLAAGLQTLVGVGSVVNSVIHSDGHGIAFGSAGTIITVTGTVAEGLGVNWAKAVPVVGYFVNGIATARDLKNTGKDVSKCLNHT